MYFYVAFPTLIGGKSKTMNTQADDSNEQNFDDLRQVMARQARKRDEKSRSVLGILRAGVAEANGTISQMLESRIIVSLAVSLSVAFIVLVIQSHRNNSFSAGLIRISETEQEIANSGTVANANDGIANDGKDQTAENPSSGARVDRSQIETDGSFVLKVGTFRDPSNAKRVAERLQKQSSNVKTEVLGSGLYVVTLGPFSKRGAAEEIARSVQDAIGLAPEVLRQDFE